MDIMKPVCKQHKLTSHSQLIDADCGYSVGSFSAIATSYHNNRGQLEVHVKDGDSQVDMAMVHFYQYQKSLLLPTLPLYTNYYSPWHYECCSEVNECLFIHNNKAVEQLSSCQNVIGLFQFVWTFKF